MPLFHVQDHDAPAWVVAKNYAEAITKWEAVVAKDNDGLDIGLPYGVQHVCDDTELIIETDWAG